MSRRTRDRAQRSGQLAGVVALSTLLLAAATCTEFQRPQEGSCGNLIREDLEDCDLPGNTTSDAGFACGQPSEGPAIACHWLCNSDGDCPSLWCDPRGAHCNASQETCESDAEEACQPQRWICDTQGQVCHQPKSEFTETVESLALTGSTEPLFSRVSGLWVADIDGQVPSELFVQGGEKAEDLNDTAFAAFFGADATSTLLRRERVGLKRGVPLTVSTRAKEPAVLMVASHPQLPSVFTLRGQADGSMVPGFAAQFGGLSERALLTPYLKQNVSGTFGASFIFDGSAAYQFAGYLVSGPLPGFLLGAPMVQSLPTDFADSDEFMPIMATATMPPDAAQQVQAVLAVAVRTLSESGVYESEVRVLPGPRVRLPRDKHLSRDSAAVWFARINDDAFEDLLVAANDGNTYVAYGVSELFDAFHSTPDYVPFSGEPPDNTFNLDPFIVGAHPLTVGLIDNDQRADFVFPRHGVASSSPDASGQLFNDCPVIQSDVVYGGCQNPEDSALLTEALIADVNDDDIVDILLIGDGPNVLAALSDGVLLHGHILPTAGRPELLRVVDLDKDLVNDIVFVIPSASPDEPAVLYVAYGTTSGGPEPPVRVLEAPRFTSVTTSNQLEILSEDADGVRSISGLEAKTDRQLGVAATIPCITPLQGASADQLTIKQQLTAGRFGAGPGVDAALLYRDCFDPNNDAPQDRLVLFPSGAQGGLESVLGQPLDAADCPGGTLLTCPSVQQAMLPTSIPLPVPPGWTQTALLASGDLDAGSDEGVEELILIGPDPLGSRLYVAESDGQPQPRFAFRQDETLTLPLGGDYAAVRGGLSLADLNDDGFLDLIALTTPPEGEAPKLALFLNRGDGTLEVDDRLEIALPLGVRAFALLDSDLDGRKDDLLLAADDGVSLAQLSDDLTLVTASVAVDNAGQGRVVGARHVVATDFDGDNLTDFAVSDGTIVRVFRSLAKNP